MEKERDMTTKTHDGPGKGVRIAAFDLAARRAENRAKAIDGSKMTRQRLREMARTEKKGRT
jgi:hypothetical protein